MARQTEAVKQQQSNLRSECAKQSGSEDRVISRSKPSQNRQRIKSGHGAKEKFNSHSQDVTSVEKAHLIRKRTTPQILYCVVWEKPGCSPLSVLGVLNMLLQRGNKHTLEEVYVVKSLHSALLGRPAITKSGLVTRVDGISIHTL